MKKIIRKNWVLLLAFFFLVGIFIINSYNYVENYKNIQEKNSENIQYCKENNIPNEKLEYCKAVLEQGNQKIEFYSMFYSTYTQGYYYLSFILFLFVVIPVVKYISNFFKNNIFKNLLTRVGYRKSIFKLFLETYKMSLILPLLTIIAVIVCYIVTGNSDYNYALKNSLVVWSIDSMKNWLIFILIYILKVSFISIIYVNISLIVCKKNHNFITATIISYLSFLGIEIFLEVICNALISNMIFKSQFGMLFNIISIFSLFDYYGVVYSILIPFLLMLISFIVVYFCYRNKEKLIIECEKNA